MDKTIVNTEIINMRKEVRRARAHVISKLVREIRRLQAKKGTPVQKEKNSKKANNLLKQVMAIKKLKEDDVSKFALTNTKDLPQIFCDTSVSVQDKAVARLGCYKNITTAVSKFRSCFPDWEHKLPALLAGLGSRYKNRKINKQKIAVMNEKGTRKEERKLVTDHVVSDDREELNEEEKDNIQIGKKKVSKRKKGTEVTVGSERSKENTGIKCDQESRGLAVVQRFMDLTDSDPIISFVDQPAEGLQTQVADPFFISDDTAADQRISEQGHNAGKLQNVERRNQRDSERFKISQNQRQHENRPRELNRKERRQKMFNQGSRNESEVMSTLHPSWEAKKKLKEMQAAVFQGKKIKFDDD